MSDGPDFLPLLLKMTEAVSGLTAEVKSLAENFGRLEARIMAHEEAHSLLVSDKEFGHLSERSEETRSMLTENIKEQTRLNSRTHDRLTTLENSLEDLKKRIEEQETTNKSDDTRIRTLEELPAQQALSGQNSTKDTVKTVVITVLGTGILGTIVAWFAGLFQKGGHP